MGDGPGTGRLTPEFVAGHQVPGKYFDHENGLMLRITRSGSRSWIQRITVRGEPRELGLGGWPTVSLETARSKASINRRIAQTGGDPGTARLKTISFEEAFERCVALLEPGWKDGGKSARQWRQSMESHAYPHLQGMGVDAIEPRDIICVLTPIWNTKEETARRVRQRVRRVLQWARAHGYASGPNPVDSAVEAMPRQPRAGRHFPAVPYDQVQDSLAKVFGSAATPEVKLSFGFLVLTAARGGEVRLARWQELDIAGRTWTVPAGNTKTGRPHRVPLSDSAMRITATVGRGRGLIFPATSGRPLSDSTHSTLMRSLGIPGVPHGFRSSFRDWASEIAGVPREVAELSLGHIFYRDAEKSYARSDLLEQRRPLMEAWSAYVMPEDAFGAARPRAIISGGGGKDGELVVGHQHNGRGTGGAVAGGRRARSAADPVDRIVRVEEACRISGLSRSAIYRMTRSGRFPMARRLTRQAIGWRLSEIMVWMDGLPVSADLRDRPDDGAPGSAGRPIAPPPSGR